MPHNFPIQYFLFFQERKVRPFSANHVPAFCHSFCSEHQNKKLLASIRAKKEFIKSEPFQLKTKSLFRININK